MNQLFSFFTPTVTISILLAIVCIFTLMSYIEYFLGPKNPIEKAIFVKKIKHIKNVYFSFARSIVFFSVMILLLHILNITNEALHKHLPPEPLNELLQDLPVFLILVSTLVMFLFDLRSTYLTFKGKINVIEPFWLPKKNKDLMFSIHIVIILILISILIYFRKISTS